MPNPPTINYKVTGIGKIGKLYRDGNPVVLEFLDGHRALFRACDVKPTEAPITPWSATYKHNSNPKTKPKLQKPKSQPRQIQKNKGSIQKQTIKKMLATLKYLKTQDKPVPRAYIENYVGSNVQRCLASIPTKPDTITLESMELVKRFTHKQRGHSHWTTWQITPKGYEHGTSIVKSIKLY